MGIAASLGCMDPEPAVGRTVRPSRGGGGGGGGGGSSSNTKADLKGTRHAKQCAKGRNIAAEVAKVLQQINSSQPDDKKIPAMSVAVADLQGVIASGCAGAYSSADSTPVTLDSIWHIGSTTKPFANLLFAIVCLEDKSMTLETTLAKALPHMADELSGSDYADVTIKELMQHKSGLPGNTEGELTVAYMSAIGDTHAELVAREGILRAFFAKHKSSVEKRGEFLYSNLGYTVIGHIAEAHAKKVNRRSEGNDWFTLCQHEIFLPTGILNAISGPPPEGPFGHAPDYNSPCAGNMDNPPFMTPAGRLAMPVYELAHWGSLCALWTMGQNVPGVKLSPATAQSVLQVYGATHDGSNTAWYTRLHHLGSRVMVVETNCAYDPNPVMDAGMKLAETIKRD